MPTVVDSRSWLEKKLSVKDLRVTIGHDIREFALLWLVFSLLDQLIKLGHLTAGWVVGNALFCVAIWATGAYIELRF